MTYAPEFVQFDIEGAVGLITIDRPPLNVYDDLLHYEYERAWKMAGSLDEVRVVLVRATGKHFCAGADTRGEHRRRPEGAEHMEPWDEFELIRNTMKPTIAAVQGGCIGGGQRMVFPCDLIFCSSDAYFRDPTARFGIGGIQSHLHTWFYGPRLAKEMIYSGEPLSATRLYQMGSINKIFEREDLWTEASSFAGQLATMAPLPLRQAKRASNITMDIMGMHYISSRMAELMDVPASFDMTGDQ